MAGEFRRRMAQSLSGLARYPLRGEGETRRADAGLSDVRAQIIQAATRQHPSVAKPEAATLTASVRSNTAASIISVGDGPAKRPRRCQRPRDREEIACGNCFWRSSAWLALCGSDLLRLPTTRSWRRQHPEAAGIRPRAR